MKNGPGTLFFCSNLRFEISWYDYSKLYHLWEYSLRTFISDLFPSPAQGAGVEGEGRDRKRKKKSFLHNGCVGCYVPLLSQFRFSC